MRRLPVRARLALPCALMAVLAGAGCGGLKAPDLFIVTRTGQAPHAHLTLLVNDEGGVRCNGGPMLKLSDSQLVQARTIQEETHDQAEAHLSLPPKANSVLSYHLREESGTVSFADNSAGQPAILHQLQLFVLRTAQQVCHLPE